MASFRFASLEHSDCTAYEFDSIGSRYDSKNDVLAHWAWAYATLGDGMIQHAPEYRVHADRMTDFLRSLAVHVAKPENAADLEKLSEEWRQYKFVQKTVEFLMDVKHVPYDADNKKTWNKKYINTNEMKVSAAKSKRHDKRWVEITEGMDGSIGFCMTQICDNEWVNGLIAKFALMYEITEVFRKSDRWFGADALPLGLFGLAPDSRHGNEFHDLEYAFRVVDGLVVACHGMKWCRRAVEGFEVKAAEKQSA